MKLSTRVERAFACGLVAVSLLACEQPSDNTIESARNCVNNATSIALSSSSTSSQSLAAAMGSQCYTMVQGLSTAQAYQIQFGALMLASGLMSQVATIVNAKNTSTGTDGLAVMMSYMSGPPAQPITTGGQPIATLMASIATSANDPGMLYFSGLVNMAVALGQIASLAAGSGTSVTAALTTCQSTPSCASTIATSFSTFQSGACASTSDQQSTDPNNLCYKSKQITQTCPGYPNSTPAQLTTCINTYAQHPALILQ